MPADPYSTHALTIHGENSCVIRRYAAAHFSFLICCPSINPITGHVEEPMPNPIEEMTEEQKEYEAQKLVYMFDK